MHIGCLQFAPRIGKVKENIAHVDRLLEAANTFDLDLLVLPELAFSGYNFDSLSAIKPYLEPTASGPTARWAANTARRLSCIVSVGYPETTQDPLSVPTSVESDTTNTVRQESSYEVPQEHSVPSQTSYNYNATITVAPDGKVLAHYRKTHLYYTDETWASESPSGWLTCPLPVLPPRFRHIGNRQSTSRLRSKEGPQETEESPAEDSGISPNIHISNSIGDATTSTLTSFGICMDLNSYRFLAEWTAYEFATHAAFTGAAMVVCSMAWLTRLEREQMGYRPGYAAQGLNDEEVNRAGKEKTMSEKGNREGGDNTKQEYEGRLKDEEEGDTRTVLLGRKPDIDTLYYWLARLKPLLTRNSAPSKSPHRQQTQEETNRTASPSLKPSSASPPPATVDHQQPSLLLSDLAPGISPATISSPSALSLSSPSSPSQSEPPQRRILVICNRTGIEPGAVTSPSGEVVDVEARYAGTSCVIDVDVGHDGSESGDDEDENSDDDDDDDDESDESDESDDQKGKTGKIRVLGILGCREEGLLRVDTEKGLNT